MSTKRDYLKKLGLLTFLIYVFMWQPVAHAVLGVEDTALLAEQAITTANTASALINQAEMIANQIKFIENQVKNLAEAPFGLWREFRFKMSRLMSLYYSIRGLSFQWERIMRQFNQVYPGWQYYVQDDSTDYAGRVYWWRKTTQDSIQDAMESQSIAGDVENDIFSLDRAIAASDGAVGSLSAIQAGNQMSALVVSQLMDLKDILAKSTRQQSTYLAQQMGSHEMDTARIQKQKEDWVSDGHAERMTEAEFLTFKK